MSDPQTQITDPGPLPVLADTWSPSWERLSKRDILSVAFKYKILIVSVFVASLAVTLLMLMIRPPHYEVEARILIKYGKDVSSNPRSSMTPYASQMVSPARPDVNTEAEMIRSYALIERVVRELKLDQPRPPVVPDEFVPRVRYELRRAWGQISGALDELQYRLAFKERLTPKEMAIMEILNGLKVEGVKESSVIDIKLQTTFRKDSSVILNRLVEAYRDARLGIERTPEVEKFFTDEASLYGERLRLSEDRLNALKTKTESASLPDQIGMQTRIIAESERALNETSNRLAEASAQATLLQQQVSGEKPTAVLQQVQSRNALLDDLAEKKATLLLKQQELLSKYNDDDVHVLDVKQQLATVSKMIADADGEVSNSRTTGENSVYVDLRKQLATAVRQRDSLQARLSSEQRELAGYREHFRSLEAMEPEYSQLARAVESNGENYKLYQRNAAEARAAESLNSQGITGIAFMDPAVDPILPSGIRRIYVFLGALAGGLLLGPGLALILEAISHTVATPDDVTRHTALPVLATFPRMKGKRLNEKATAMAAAGAANLALYTKSSGSQHRGNTVLFFGANPGAGASHIARWFADAFSTEMKERVLLVFLGQGDPLAGTSRKLLPTFRGIDLTAIEVPSEENVTSKSSGVDEGYLPAGLSVDQIATHLRNVRDRLPHYDRILIDLPARVARENALAIARECAAVVVVAEAEKTRYEVLDWVRREFHRYRVPVVGAVLNKRQFHIPNFIYRRI